VSNGLGSPLCRNGLGEGELPGRSSRNCATSGFVAAAAPSGDYGIDVHIDTGIVGLSFGSLVQDLFVTPLWMALVWAAHALVVMLEWCFTIDLLDSSSTAGLGRGLRHMQAAFTEPWLVLVLAAASVLAAYDGLVRRRVGEAIGEAALAGAMIVCGLWVIADPTGTVGALGGWANKASVGTLAVAARGSPAAPERALAQSMEAVFSAAVEVPWCYVEFGDVGWCRDRDRLDGRLRAAALSLAGRELARIGCAGETEAGEPCARRGSAQAQRLSHSAQLVREAQTNGELFLAFPANGPARNSINDHGSLLYAICRSSEATDCHGPSAAAAEFRTSSGTWPRMVGLVLIAAGMLGLLLLFGFIALRLLGAAIFSLLYLLLAPGAVLAPALGESGRAVFRKWVVHLVGAVVSKLLFSLLLGVVLAVMSILAGLRGLGWWTQWLLMSAFWWGAYARRHQALAFARGGAAGPARPVRRSVKSRVAGAFVERHKRTKLAETIAKKLPKPGPPRGPQRPERVPRPESHADEQSNRLHGVRLREREGGGAGERLDARRAQLERVRLARTAASMRGNRRRAARLEHRGRRIEGEIQEEERRLADSQLPLDGKRSARRRGSDAASSEQAPVSARFLDTQAALPAASARGARGVQRRDYASLAALAGYTRAQYERLSPGEQRATRLEVDRELARRRELLGCSANASVAPSAGSQRRQNPHAGERVGRRDENGRGGGPADAQVPRRPTAAEESSVMRDAMDLAAKRRRQLGRDRA
jgi:hypothetical protein